MKVEVTVGIEVDEPDEELACELAEQFVKECCVEYASENSIENNAVVAKPVVQAKLPEEGGSS